MGWQQDRWRDWRRDDGASVHLFDLRWVGVGPTPEQQVLKHRGEVCRFDVALAAMSAIDSAFPREEAA